MTLIYILISNLIISCGSLIGLVFLIWQEKVITKWLMTLVALSAGTLVGGAFLHLLPEAASFLPNLESMFYILIISFGVFFLIEKFLHWRHCHKGYCEVHTFGYMNLLGDGIHNLIDGLIIAATFVVSIKLGILTTLAIALHEIPQEIGDFGVLLHSGFSKKKALLANFLIALLAVIGGISGYLLSSKVNNLISYLLPFAAGGFIYIAMSDLMPELRKETSLRKSLLSFSFFVAGIVIMYVAKFFGG